MNKPQARGRDYGDVPLREYVGLIWIGEEPGRRIRIMAASGEEAEELLVQDFGAGHVYTLWNEEDAGKPR